MVTDRSRASAGKEKETKSEVSLVNVSGKLMEK